MPFKKYSRWGFKKMRRNSNLAFKAWARTGTKRSKSNRIFKRFIRRSAPKPELKWILTTQANAAGNTIPQGMSNTQAITPLTIPTGTDEHSRIGRQVKLFKTNVTFYVRSTEISQTTYSNAQNIMIRMMIWSPRISQTKAQTAMEALSMESQFDHDIVTMYSDYSFNIYPDRLATGAPNTTNIGNQTGPSTKIIKRMIRFPRKVYVAGDDNTLDIDKDVLYVTFHSSGLLNASTTYFMSAKNLYFDN